MDEGPDGAPPAAAPRLRPWPRCRTCGSLIQVATGRCVSCDLPPGPLWPPGQQEPEDAGRDREEG